MKLHNATFPYYTFDNLEKFQGLKHFVTSCSQDSDTDVNLRSPKGAANRQRLAVSVGFDIKKLVTGEQTHSLNIAKVTENSIGMGNLDIDSRIPNTDAMITNVSGICLMVLTADCVPILLYDNAKHAIAAIHAGWRGTANGIVGLTVKKMIDEFKTKPDDIYAAIGPCIGTCCFEVGEDVAEQFCRQSESIIRNPVWIHPHIDLAQSNFSQLLTAGVNPGNVDMARICTKCNHSDFFSHRYNKTLGRIGTGIILT